ncbi:hypothetical protein C8B47_10815 [filamentous cyanobacterium CCP4]|nr:hypothetical protein C8B47_10815 [filamentous cyanobacterium CCP4]
MIKASIFKEEITPREIYRVNRIRLAEHFHISPVDVDAWDAQTYYDALDVRGADEVLSKLGNL